VEGAKDHFRMHNIIPSAPTGNIPRKLSPLNERDFMLRNLRIAVLRTRLIAEDLTLIGTLLRDGHITPEDAVSWADEIAPGCLVVVATSLEYAQ
jgi:hypothetical protein